MATNTLQLVDRPVDGSIPDGKAQRARFHAPRFRRTVVKRRRLLTRLAAARDRRVALLCAPAGFGKTILAAQLTRGDPRPNCWITLEDADNDPLALLTDLVSALGTLGSIQQRLAHELESLTPRIDEVVLPMLAGQLAGYDPFVLALDHVEVLTDARSLAILSFLVDHAPEGSQLVLATRVEPEMPLARLRAAGDVLDLGAAELALDVHETRELLATADLTMGDEQVEEIRERSEGWAAGLALTVFSQAGREDVDDLPATVVGGGPDIAAYLLEEAVERQPPDVRRFLLTSSVLRRMSPALCDAALEIEDSGRILAALDRTSMFIVPLEGEGDWYRYHRLFRELLQVELGRQAPEVIENILNRAAAWHEEQGDPSEAFEYAHACGDLRRAGRVIRRHGNSYVRRGQIGTSRAWLARCTPEEIASDPQLALAGAWIALFSGDAAEAWRLAAVAETAGDLDVPSSDGATSLRSALASLRATIAADGVSQMLRDAEFVVAAEGARATRWVMDGWRQFATAHLLKGSHDEAIAAFAEVLLRTNGHPDLNFLAVHCLGYSALAAADAGDWRRARRWARDARALTVESGLEHALQSAAPYTAHAKVLAHDGLLVPARNALQNARRIIPMLHAVRWLEADIGLRCADISLDLGDTTAALELADVARGALNHYPDPGMLHARLTALDTRLSRGGELELTPSEQRLIPFLSSHLSLQEIGDRLFLSRATVKTHTDSIYRKLDVSSRSDTVDRLEALGLCHPQPGGPAAVPSSCGFGRSPIVGRRELRS